MQPSNINDQSSQLRSLLRVDMIKASERLREFADEFAVTPRLKFKSAALRSAVNRSSQGDELIFIKTEIDQLIEDIIKDNYTKDTPHSLRKESSDFENRHLNLNPSLPTAIECLGFRKSYLKQDFKLEEVNFRFRLGEVTGIVGENGHGKTTFLKIISGLLKADGGEINYPLFNHHNTQKQSLVNTKIGFLPQNLPFQHGTVRQNLQLSASIHGITGKHNDFEVEYIINRIGLTGYEDTPYGKLAGGYQLRLALAKLLIWKPQILILDEPLANLDINAKNALLNDLRCLADSVKYPICVILSSQDLEEVESVSDNMIVLRKGRMIFGGKTSEIGNRLSQHVYEIKTAFSLKEIKRKLNNLPFDAIEDKGFANIVTTPLAIDRKVFMTYCMVNNIELRYFNDISHSVKRLIINQSSTPRYDA